MEIKSDLFIFILVLSLIIQTIFHTTENPQKQSFGDIAPDFSEIDIHGNAQVLSSLRGNSVLVIFFDPMNSFHKLTMLYADVLYRKYKKNRFEILAISNRNQTLSRLNAEKCRLSFAVIADEDYSIHELYGIPRCCGGTVFVNSKRQIFFFSSTLSQPEHLRQITEQLLTGDIIYRFKKPKEQEIFKINTEVLDYPLYSLENNNYLDLNVLSQDPLILTIFSSFCNVCKTGRRIQTLIHLQDKMRKNNPLISVAAVFTEPFEKKDIREFTHNHSIPFDIYIGPEILSLEQKYITDDNLRNNPLTVLIYKNTVLFVELIGMEEEELIRIITKIF